jgi:hypothetical protein
VSIDGIQIRRHIRIADPMTFRHVRTAFYLYRIRLDEVDDGVEQRVTAPSRDSSSPTSFS